MQGWAARWRLLARGSRAAITRGAFECTRIDGRTDLSRPSLFFPLDLEGFSLSSD